MEPKETTETKSEVDRVIDEVQKARDAGVAELNTVSIDALNALIDSSDSPAEKIRKWSELTLQTGVLLPIVPNTRFFRIDYQPVDRTTKFAQRRGQVTFKVQPVLSLQQWQNSLAKLVDNFDVEKGEETESKITNYQVRIRGTEDDPLSFKVEIDQEKGMVIVRQGEANIELNAANLKVICTLIGISEDDLTQLISESSTKSMSDVKTEVANKFKTIQDFFNDPKVRQTLSEDTQHAVRTLFEEVPTSIRDKCIETLTDSARQLPLLIAELSLSRQIRSNKQFYLDRYGAFLFSRAADIDIHKRNGVSELSLISEGKFDQQLYGCIIDPSQGESYRFNPNRIYIHFKERVAHQCRFYSGDVDHTDSNIRSMDYFSFVDAKVLYSLFYPGLFEGRTFGVLSSVDKNDIERVCVANNDDKEFLHDVYPQLKVEDAKAQEYL